MRKEKSGHSKANVSPKPTQMRSMNGCLLCDPLYGFKLTVGLTYTTGDCCDSNRDASCRCKNFCDGRDNQHFCLILAGNRIFGGYVHYQKIYHLSTWQVQLLGDEFVGIEFKNLDQEEMIEIKNSKCLL